MDKLKMHSPDMTQENIKKIQALFPNCVTEARDENGKLRLAIDFDQLKQELSDAIVEGPQERYHLNWPGKREALLASNAPIAKTLRPVSTESVDFESTKNLFLEGDNLDVLKALQESYLGRVRMIYIDPPYNTGRDFIYRDNRFESTAEYLSFSQQEDDSGYKLTSNPDSIGRFHSNWLSMMYSRLRLARNLLKDNGVIFLSIDDNEVDNLKKICNEIFGEENFIGCAGRITKKSNNKGDFWAPNFDYILTYVKNIELAEEFFGGANEDAYNLIETEGARKGERYQLVRLYMSTIRNRNPEQRYWIDCPDGTRVIPPGDTLPPERPILGDGIWRWTKKKFDAERDKIVVKKVRSSNLLSDTGRPAEWNVYTKTYLNDVIDNSTAKPNSFIEGFINQMGSHEMKKLGIPFDYSKPSDLIKYLMKVSKVKGDDIVMDFFAGSGTTGDAVMQLNAEDGEKRRFILVQIPEAIDDNQPARKLGLEKITDLAKERLKRRRKQLLDDLPSSSHDFGFRVFKLDSSNMSDVHYFASDLEQSELLFNSGNIKKDRGDEDLLFQILLDWGIEISNKIQVKIVEGKKCFIVDDCALIGCFDENIDTKVVRKICEFKPLRVVFKDQSFLSDSEKVNAEQVIRQLSPETELKVI